MSGSYSNISFDSFSTSIAPMAHDGPRKVTQTPVTTGTSVLGLMYNGGVVFAADTLASYGSLARYKSCQRIIKVNEKTIIGCMGDYADFQYISKLIEQMAIDDACKDDNITMSPRSVHSWITRTLYNKRCKIDPLWTTFVVGGIDEGKPYLGFVDKLGAAFEDPIIATGYGSMIATPLMRNEWKPDLTEEEATVIVKKAMTLLYYRDARSFNKFHLGVVNDSGCKIEGPLAVDEDWEIADSVKGY